MINSYSKTTVTESSKRRTTKASQIFQESTNGDLSNGSSYHIKDNEADRSWDFMNYSDYLDYRSGGKNISLSDTLFEGTLHGFRWDIVEELQRGKSGSIDTSRSSNPITNEEGSNAPGFVFKFYKKYGFYWNVFPKTDYCYLPGSPDYHKEISPGIPKVPNLSRYPLSSYIRRGVSAEARHNEKNLDADTSFSFSENSFLNSTTFEKTTLNQSSNASKIDWHGNIKTRKSLSNNHKINYRREREERHSFWRSLKTLMTSISTTIWSAIVMTVTTTVTVSRSVMPVPTSELSRSRSWLPMFLFLFLLLPLVLYYLLPGVLGANQQEIVTAVSSPASGFVSWAFSCLYSALYLVKESLLFIPTIYFQLVALFTTNTSYPFKAESTCTDLPAPIIAVPQTNFSALSDEKLLSALQTNIIEKIKAELAGQNNHLAERIEQVQDQLSHLSEEMKKLNYQFEEEQKDHFHRLKGEIADLRESVIDARDKVAVGNLLSPSEKLVERAVAKYHADRTGEPDYALQSSGGYVVRVRCTQTYSKTSANLYIFGFELPWPGPKGPETIITPGVMPGECWAFEGSFAQVIIHLSTKVRVTSFSLEHTPKELTLHGNISSAPKQFSVWALKSEDDKDPFLLGRFEFLDNGENLQQFDALKYDQPVDLIELKIESNHGHPEYTCVYRIRVHGKPWTKSIEAGGNITTDLTALGSFDSSSGPDLNPYR